MNIQNLVITFLNFFKHKGYQVKFKNEIINYAENDLLFINSGVAGIFDKFTNQAIQKLATVQNCLRIDGKHNDFDNIGNSRSHFCSFYMLGTFCNDNANVAQMIKDIYEFLDILFSLDNTIYVTVHPTDNLATSIWQSIDKKIEIIQDENNIWSLGKTGEHGLCTEIIYKSSDMQEGIEIWNIVMVDRYILPNGNVIKHPNIKIDTGGGLERIYSIFKDQLDIYLTDEHIEFINGMLRYTKLQDAKIILDAIKAIGNLLINKVVISNNKHGYILKKLVRRLISTLISNNITFETLLYYGSKYMLDIPHFTYIYETEYKAIKKCDNTLLRYMKDKSKVSLSDVVKLHDTYGVHYYNTIAYAQSAGIEYPDEEEIKQKLYIKPELKAIKKIITKITESKFIYDQESIKLNNSQFEFLNINFEPITQISNNNTFIVITELTTLYPESGGQACDKGYIYFDKNLIAKVDKVYRQQKLIIHECTCIITTDIYKLDKINLKIDIERRHLLSNSHTIHHMLIASIEHLTNTPMYQQSSNINTNRTTVSFYSIQNITAIIDAQILERYLNEIIQSKKYKIMTEEISLEKAINENFKMIMCSYPSKVRSIKIKLDNKIFSKELCSGTHLDEAILYKISIDSISALNSYNTKITYTLSSLDENL